jgi:membrane protease YdiL (CAAX protease family)
MYCGASLYPLLAAAAPPAPPRERTPWGYGDMAMAIGMVIGALILLFIPLITIVAIVAGGEIDEGDDAVTAAVMGAGFLLEGFLLLAAALFSVAKYNLSWSALGLRLPRRGGFWFPVPLFFAALAVFISYAAIVAAIGGDVESNVAEETFDSTVLIVLLGILSLALAPFMEEVFFRGFLFGGLRGRWGVLGAALASGFLFALAHFQDASSLPLIPVIGIIGMLFAWAYYYTGSLFAPIAAHFSFNLVSFVFGVLGVAS